MLGYHANRGGITISVKKLARKLRPSGNAIKKRVISAWHSLVAMGIAAGMFIVAFGVHVPLPFLYESGNQAGASQVATIQTNLVANSPTSCSAAEKQSNTLFTACPSFYIDYGTQRNGLVGSGIFNTYAGAPVANDEAQYYTKSPMNVRAENGSLVLQALNQPDHGYNYTSARLDTHGKEDFLYGKIVVRAKLPGGIGTWPSIWLLPSQAKYASLSPSSDTTRYLNDGEIDIAEAVGTQPNVVYGIAHSLAYPEDGVNHAYFNTMTVPGNDTSYHDYEVDWTPTTLTFKVDGKTFFTYSKKPHANYRSWPFDQPFYLVLNLALGGTWGGTDTAQFPGDGVDKSALPASLNVQSIRYYSYAGRH